MPMAADAQTGCSTVNGESCIFPFEYDGQSYSSCTFEGYAAPWCYTDSTSSSWDVCSPSCPMDTFDPCPYANDGMCDVPDYCPVGDYNDCGGASSASTVGTDDPCPYANDGMCDVPDYCPTGDHADCGGGEHGAGSGSGLGGLPPSFFSPESFGCEWENDGYCDVPEYCLAGTDLNDCGASETAPPTPPQPIHQPCDCTEGLVTANGPVVSYAGCGDHMNEGFAWCYVKGGVLCRTATPSQTEGAAWKCCNGCAAPPTPTPPPPPPPSTSVTQIPPGLVCRNVAGGGRRNKRPIRAKPLVDGARPSGTSRVVGGVEANKNTHPWIVRLQVGDYLCGGTILNANFVVTAAHCLYDADGNAISHRTMYVNAGDHDSYVDNEPGEQQRSVAAIYKHEGYDPTGFTDDIAIFKLQAPLVLSSKVAPACLPERGFEPEDGSIVFAAGWGTTSEGGETPRFLQEVDLQYHRDGNAACQASSDPLKMLCAGKPAGGQDTCQGDSGGPLIHVESSTKTPVLIGVTSFGEGCARAGGLGVYVDVVNYLDWINEVLAGSDKHRPFAGTGSATVSDEFRALRADQKNKTAATPASTDSPPAATRTPPPGVSGAISLSNGCQFALLASLAAVALMLKL